MEENYYEEGFLDPATILGILAFTFLLSFIAIITQWCLFRKAEKPGWASLIPIYNLYIYLKVVGKPGWWILLFLIPIVNLFIAIKTVHLLSKSFGKDVGFTLGLIFLPFIFYPLLAFSSAKYQGPFGDPVAYHAYQNSHHFEFKTSGNKSELA